MNSIAKRLVAGVVALATFIPVYTTTICPQANITVLAATSDEWNKIPIRANISNIATEAEAKAAGKTYQGTYINPNKITSIENVVTCILGNQDLGSINPKAFMGLVTSTGTDPCVIGRYEYSKDSTFVGMIKLTNYNNTGYDLFYEFDLDTGKFYQSFNTMAMSNLSTGSNTSIVTRTDRLKNDAGHKLIKLGENETYMSGANWILDTPEIKLTSAELQALSKKSNSNLHLAEEAFSIESIAYDRPDDENYLGCRRQYTIFGNTWICIDSKITNRYNKTSKFNNPYVTLTSGMKESDDIIDKEGKIVSNGSKGDIIDIYSYYDFIENQWILKDNYQYDTMKNVVNGYVLKEDKEALPVAYGNYIIYNRNTGIYETTCSVYRISDYSLYGVRDRSQDEIIEMLFSTLGITYSKSMSKYDVPTRLNISNKETLTVVGINSIEDSLYVLQLNDKNNKDASQRRRLVVDAVNNSDVFNRTLDYLNVTSFNVPSNTSEFLAVYAASNRSQNGADPISISEPIRKDRYDLLMNYLLELDTSVSPSYYATFTDTYKEYESTNIKGDVNQDGQFNVADVVCMQRWLLADPSAQMSSAGYVCSNFCIDNRMDVFDLCLAKRELINKMTNYKKGDVDNSGDITENDLTLVSNHIKNIKLLTGDALKAADVNNDEKIDNSDLLAMKAHINGSKLLW